MTIRFTDAGLEPDFDIQPPCEYRPFSADSQLRDADYMRVPMVCGSFQQRRILASTAANPERLWLSKLGDVNDFSFKNRLRDNDAFWFDMSGQRINRIMHLLSLGKLVIFTESGEWVINGDEAGSITPTSVNMVQHAHYGIGKLRPLEVGGGAIFVQPRGPVVRDLMFTQESSGYQGNDLTTFSDHLFRYNSIVDWTYQQGPDSIVWCVLATGKMLAMTYLREHNIMAWTRHDMDGDVESICAIPERDGDSYRDTVYIAVRRVIDGRTTRSVERMAKTHYDFFPDYVYLDGATKFDGWMVPAFPMGYVASSDVTRFGGGSGRLRRYYALPDDDAVGFINALLSPAGAGARLMTRNFTFTARDVGKILYPDNAELDFRFLVTAVSGNYASIKYVDEYGVGAVPPSAVSNLMKVADNSFRLCQYMKLEVENAEEGWTANGLLKITTGTSGYFAGTAVGDEIWFGKDESGQLRTPLRVIIKSHNGDKIAYGIPDRTVPTAWREVATSSWGLASRTISNLTHLEGKSVGVYGDGNCIASPNNPAYPALEVSNGQVTLPRPCVSGIIGLPFTSDMELLDIDTNEGETYADKQKIVTRVTLHLDRAKGGFVGPELPDGDDTLDGMVELKYDSGNTYEGAAEPKYGKYSAVIDNTWNNRGRVALRQVDPLPMDIMAVHPSLNVSSRR